jgi:hypothetical protein
MIADTFNPTRSAGVLKQTINGMLNNTDGKADSGSFDLILADDFARCTFGLLKGGTLKGKAVGQTSTTKSSTGWVSTSLTGISYAKATTVMVQIKR